MEQLFVALYPLVTVASLAAYIPQILELVRAKSGDDRISLKSWAVWSVTSLISLGYGMFHLKDVMFMMTMGFGLAAILAVIALVLYNRHVRFARSVPVPAE